MTTDVEFNNRFAVPLDDKNTLNVVREEPREVPLSGILDEPLYCLKFNEEWRPHIIGAVDTLTHWKNWIGVEDETNEGTQQMLLLMEQDFEDCGDGGGEPCDIPTIIADDEYFETEYLPKVFGEYYSQTVTNETTQAALYDGTPQSIGENIPTGTPSSDKQISLCAAVNRFVSLYASTKLCLIQSKNYLEVMFTKIANAANNFYDFAAQLMSPIYSPNIFSCFVSDAAAITALQNDSAIETLACYLYDELKTVTMSQANFDAAILDAATTLTGDAQKIACIMNNDNNLSLYINMLEAYQIAILDADADCPCETSTYWRLYLDFRTGNRYGTSIVLWNGAPHDGRWTGTGYEYNPPGSPASSLNVSFGFPALGGEFVIRGMAAISDRLGSDSGSNDFQEMLVFGGETFTSFQGVWHGQNSIPDGDNQIHGAIFPFASTPSASFQHRARVLQATDASPRKLRVHQIVVWGLADGSGNKPELAQWVGSTLPATVPELFP